MNDKLDELVNVLDAELIKGSDVDLITEVAYDSRMITNGQNVLFFALEGKQRNGHDFLQHAYQQSVRNFVVKSPNQQLKNANFIIVDSPIRALQQLAKHHRQKYTQPLIAITGTNGKTIVKEWLHQLLYQQYTLFRSPKSYNSQIGVPISVLQINNKDSLAIIEAGISKANEMTFLEDILQPNIGVLTKMGSAHSSGFKNREEHIKEKLNLFKRTNILVYTDEDEDVNNYVATHYKTIKTISFGSQPSSTLRLIKVDCMNHNSKLHIQYQNQTLDFELPFTDKASQQNALCVLATLIALEEKWQDFLPKFKHLKSVEMRLELLPALHNCIVINDSFNSDLQSVKIALQLLSQQTKTKKNAILTDLQDSNMPEASLYQEMANLVNQYNIDDLILIGETIIKYQKLFAPTTKTYQNTNEFIAVLPEQNFQDAAILLKGARQFRLEKIAQRLQTQTHDTVLEIDLDGMIHNLNAYRSFLQPTTKIMAMVKAFSYGAGDYEVAQMLVNQGVDYLGVAYADEGVVLRNAGIKLPIMVMNPEQSSYNTMIRNNLEPEIYSFRVLDLFVKELKNLTYKGEYPIHLKINTGMNRLGFKPQEINQLSNILQQNQQLKIKSVFSHLACSSNKEEKEFTMQQIKAFNQACNDLQNQFNYPFLKHILNSEGIINFPDYQFDMIRIGMGMYGFSASPQLQEQLRNVFHFKTVISQIHQLKKGESVGYNRSFIAQINSRIATLPVGYADGVNRHLSNGLCYVSINQQKATIIGDICMDMMMVDVTNINCQEGDSVMILGEDPSPKHWAKQLNTITYEVLTAISQRVKRVYLKD